jgi:hypothetical protein
MIIRTGEKATFSIQYKELTSKRESLELIPDTRVALLIDTYFHLSHAYIHSAISVVFEAVDTDIPLCWFRLNKIRKESKNKNLHSRV